MRRSSSVSERCNHGHTEEHLNYRPHNKVPPVFSTAASFHQINNRHVGVIHQNMCVGPSLSAVRVPGCVALQVFAFISFMSIKKKKKTSNQGMKISTNADLRSELRDSEGARPSQSKQTSNREPPVCRLRRPPFDRMSASPGQRRHLRPAAVPGRRNHTEGGRLGVGGSTLPGLSAGGTGVNIY